MPRAATARRKRGNRAPASVSAPPGPRYPHPASPDGLGPRLLQCSAGEKPGAGCVIAPLSHRTAGEGAERSEAGEGQNVCHLSPALVGRQRGVERQQREVRRTVGAVNAEAPAEGRGNRGEPLAMTPKAFGIILADAFDAADHDLVALLDTIKAHTSVE